MTVSGAFDTMRPTNVKPRAEDEATKAGRVPRGRGARAGSPRMAHGELGLCWLATIPGISFITASTIALSITGPGQFRSGRHVAASIVLVRRRNYNNGKERQAGTSKKGS